MIDRRDELINALIEAAEIEHGLMIQYLFPALSMKKRLDEGISAPQQRLIRGWERTLLGVAVDEMGHLGTVCNLLAAVGSGPRFSRPNFPQATGYYPFAFDLVRFGDEALYRMQVFELPRGEPLPPPPRRPPRPAAALLSVRTVAPDPLEYTYVGELYAQIRAGFAAISQATLFIGPEAAQVPSDWSVDLDMHQVTDRASAIAAIDDIIEDGEGSPLTREGSHYDRFTKIRSAYGTAGLFDAARAVVPNPCTREHRGTQLGTLITNERSRAVAELFNGAYECVLRMLQQFFAFGGETAGQREALRLAAARLMSTAVRPIAEVLSELPAGDDAEPPRAGPGFELYGDMTLSPYPDARWTILMERLDVVVAEAVRLGAEIPRLGAVGETTGFVRRSIAAVTGGSG